jgi:hypothetical protein
MIHFLSPEVTNMVKFKRITWTGHVESTSEKRNAFKILSTILKERDRLEHLRMGRRIILKYIFKKKGASVWAGYISLK